MSELSHVTATKPNQFLMLLTNDTGCVAIWNASADEGVKETDIQFGLRFTSHEKVYIVIESDLTFCE